MSARLPDGYRVNLRADVRRYHDGRLLVGGSPLRAITLTDRATGLLDNDHITVRCAASRRLAERLLDANAADPNLDPALPDVSAMTVVIPVYERAEELDRALAAVAPLPAIVVDDASPDAAPIAAVAHRHGARLIRLDDNAGPAAARNAGLAAVTTLYIAFVDSDVEVDAATLQRLARHFADDRVALVGPLVRSVARSPRPRWFERYDERASSLDLGTRGCSVSPGAAVAWLPSACLVARTDRLAAGFDETLRVGEDVDLVWRLVGSGAVVRYDPNEAARHDARSRLSGWLGRKFTYGTGGAVLARRHGAHTAVAQLSPAMALAAAALLHHRRWAIPLMAAVLAHAERRLHRSLPEPAGRALSTRLAVEGLGWALRQESALLLRHWAPPVLLAATQSRGVRRMLLGALAVDSVVVARATPPVGLRDALTGLLARRLDDLAYGAGLWCGVLRNGGRGGTWRCISVRNPARHRQAAAQPTSSVPR